MQDAYSACENTSAKLMLNLRHRNARHKENAKGRNFLRVIMQSQSIRCQPSWLYTRVSVGLRSCRIQEGRALDTVVSQQLYRKGRQFDSRLKHVCELGNRSLLP